MAGVHELSRTDARRIAVRAQLLTKERPTGLLETVQQLSLLQLDPTRAIAPSAELVVWSRLGSAYSLHELWDVVDEQRLIELRGTLRVAEDIGLYRAEMAEWPGTSDVRGWKQLQRDWVAVNNACRRDLLERLRTDGPLPARELPDTCVKPWASSGWNNNRNVTMMLDFLVQRGEVAVAGGTGRDRLWDLASRVYTDVPPVPTEEALRLRDERRLGALGIARSRGPECPVEPLDVGEAGEPAVVEGVRGQWHVDPAHGRRIRVRLRPRDVQAGCPAAVGLLRPPDPVRRPAGREARRPADRKAGVFTVGAVHGDVPFTKAMAVAVDREIGDLARWLDLEFVLPD